MLCVTIQLFKDHVITGTKDPEILKKEKNEMEQTNEETSWLPSL